MEKSKHSMNMAEMEIHRLIEALLKLFTKGKSANQEVNKLKHDRELLDTNNSDFHGVLEDRRENNKMNWRLIIIILSICVDFLLSFQAMTILCDQFGLPAILKVLVPAFLILAEIGISYFQILHQRQGEPGSWLTRNVQYFVLLILIGLSILVVLYSAQGYNSGVDGISFLSFLSGTIILQLALLVASIMLHVWLIRNAEAIAETFAYFRYKGDRGRLSSRIESLDGNNRKKYLPEFTKRTQFLVQKMESFKRTHPDSDVHFEREMPADLIIAINLVMGRKVFQIEAEVAA